jgi:hemolysin activation/secretion protein
MRHITLFLATIIALYSLPSFAITAAERAAASQALQQQEQKQENMIKYLGREYERKIRENKKPEYELPTPDEKTLPKGKCFNIKTVKLDGAQSLTKEEQDKLTGQYIGTCMDLASINKLMHDITNYYINKGNVTTRLAIPKQDLKQGTLTLMVIEGKIESIELNENTPRDKRQIAMAFPNLNGKNLNLRDIEQGLDQLNRLSSSKATMKIEPSTRAGYSRIIITNKVEKDSRASVTYDNSGQGSTGKNKVTITGEQDNLLGAGDYWSMSYNEDTATHNYQKKSQLVSGIVSVPYGYWTFSANGSYSEYVNTINVTNQEFQTHGQTSTGTGKIERVLHRDQNSKTSANVALTVKDTLNFIEDTELSASTQQLSILKAGVDHTLQALGGVWYAALNYERGMKLFGAQEDASDIASNDAHAQFDKCSFEANVYKPFAVKSANLAFRSGVIGQYTGDALFPSEQITMGDRYTVRGFQESSLSGDSGAYVRNELMWNAPQFTDNQYVNRTVGNLQPYIGLDAGVAKTKDGGGEDYISGWAIGLRNNSENMSFDVAYAQAIKHPSSVVADDETYFSVTAKVGF